MNSFIPDRIELAPQDVPYFEDIRASDVAGRHTGKGIARLQGEIIDLLTRLGADSIYFLAGQYPAGRGGRVRYGFQAHFRFQGVPGRLDCAALPLRKETPQKKDRALAQALYLLRDELKAMVNSVMYKPGAIPLVPYLIGAGGQTVTEYLIETQALPLLTSG